MQRFVAILTTLIVAIAPVTYAQNAEPQPDYSLREEGAKATAVTADGSALETAASHMVLLDYRSGTVLAEKASAAKMYPSSMTKMMTLYIIFDRLKRGIVSLDSQFTVSQTAWEMQGSKMFVPLGASIPLRDLILGIAVQSGNDACVTAAEGIAGSEAAFAQIMNDTAKKLGMKDSNFVDSSGWPNPNHYTTAHDLAVLAVALIRDFPEHYHYFAVPEFTFHNIRQFNRNRLLKDTALGVDGLKTGHTDAAGYGITLSAKEPGTNRRLVLVINGLESEDTRETEGKKLLVWGFRNFREMQVVTPGKVLLQAPVWRGEQANVGLAAAAPIILSVGNNTANALKLEAHFNGPIPAPIPQGAKLGELTVTLPNGATQSVPLVASESVARLGWFARGLAAYGL